MKLIIQIKLDHIVFLFYGPSKVAGRYNRDLSQYEMEKGKNHTFEFVGDDCITKALDFLLKVNGDGRKVKKTCKYNLQLHAHNGSGFDTWIVLNNLPCEKHIVDFFKNGKAIIEFSMVIYNITKNKFLNI